MREENGVWSGSEKWEVCGECTDLIRKCTVARQNDGEWKMCF